MADISYTPTTWADGSAGGTAIDATKLNNIETGISDAVAAIGPNDTTADGTLKAQIDALGESVSLPGNVFRVNMRTTDAYNIATLKSKSKDILESIANTDVHTVEIGLLATSSMGTRLYIAHKYKTGSEYGVIVVYGYDGYAFMGFLTSGTYTTRDL